MSKQIKVAVGTNLTIRRPNGEIEVVLNTRYLLGVIPARVYAEMVKATNCAGRGDILSQEVVYKMVDEAQPTAAELAEQNAYENTRRIERASATGRYN